MFEASDLVTKDNRLLEVNIQEVASTLRLSFESSYRFGSCRSEHAFSAGVTDPSTFASIC